ncbi:MAG: IS1380 family transposase [Planctomycetaceae bacterium]
MSLRGVWAECLDFLPRKRVVVENSAGRLSSDAGLLVVREFDERIGMTASFAAMLDDPRHDPTHAMLAMVRQRVYGILAGYEDQNDHDTLRHDPVFQLVCDRLPEDGAELASQPTLSRFENAISVKALLRLRELFVEQFIASFDEEPSRLTFDLDGFDDPAHGDQQLTLFHGYYKQKQYFPLIITNAETNLTVMVALRHGTAHAALGANEDLEFLVTRLREKWPDVDIEVRADSGFGVPSMYEVCERLGVWYTFGIGMNPRLKTKSDDLLAEALEQYVQTHAKQRLFTALAYQASTWDRSRSVVIKAEAHAAGTNRRAVVTNRPGALIVPQGVYDDYVQRGESENRNKELKIDLCGGRLSDHRFMANLFRLYLHTLALNLLVRLRSELPDPPDLDEEPTAFRPRPSPLPDAVSPGSPSGAELRRAQPATWRLRLIKVAAEVLVSSRRVLVRLSSAWPSLPTWRLVLQTVQRC